MNLDIACIMCGGDCTKVGPVNPACPRITEGALHNMQVAHTIVGGSLRGFRDYAEGDDGPAIRPHTTIIAAPDLHPDAVRERHSGYVRKWLQNPEFRAALNRATHRNLKP